MFTNPDTQIIFGRLTLESLPLHEPIVVVTFVVGRARRRRAGRRA